MAERARVGPQSSLRSDESGTHSRGAMPVDNASNSRSEPGPEQPEERNSPTQCRLSRGQNRTARSPLPQSSPKTTTRLPAATRLPNAQPHASLRDHLPGLIPELPEPTARRRTVRQAVPIAPLPNSLLKTQNRVQARLDDRRAVTLERHAERRKQADGQAAAPTAALHPPHAQPHDAGKPDLPKVHPLAPKPRPAQRTAAGNLRLNLRIVRRIRLKRTKKERN